MKNKIPLSEGKVIGNLKEITQVYKLNFMPKEENYPAKIELAILLVKNGMQEGAYRSLRFTSLAQLRSFINNLTKSYIFYGKQLGEIDPRNYEYHIERFKQFVDDIFRGNG